MPEIQFDSFLRDFRSTTNEAACAGTDDDGNLLQEPYATAFTETFVKALEATGQVSDCDPAYYEGLFNGETARINGYAKSSDGRALDMIVTVIPDTDGEEQQDSPPAPVTVEAVLEAAQEALRAFSLAGTAIHTGMEEAGPARDMLEVLHSLQNGASPLSRIRIHIIVDGKAPETGPISHGPISHGPVPDGLYEVNSIVWDLEKLFNIVAGSGNETLRIGPENFLTEPLPCLEVENASDTHRCYLTIIPGDLLHDIYHAYGTRLLELNVRAFLQDKVKVNQGIRDTIKDRPEYFFTYNNGLALTVEDLEIETGPSGTCITSMTGLQIVNGGQTTASIHLAKNKYDADLSDVRVQAKITRVEQEHLEKLVPKISKFSNAQNAVRATDFSSRHPFHIAMQRHSEAIPAPGNVNRWFYEKARGEYLVARDVAARTGEAGTFDEYTPKKMKVEKTDLAAAYICWSGRPDLKTKGTQTAYVAMMKALSAKGADNEEWTPSEDDYRDLISHVIMHREAIRLSRRRGDNKLAYPGPAAAYTLASVSARSINRVNLKSIWEHQKVSAVFTELLENWMPQIEKEMRNSCPETVNESEWFKKPECWNHIRTLKLEITEPFESELNDGLPLPTVGQQTLRGQTLDLTPEERARQAFIMNFSAEEYMEFIQWIHEHEVTEHDGEQVRADFVVGCRSCSETGAFQNGNECTRCDGKGWRDSSELISDISATISGYAAREWKKVPSPKQTQQLEPWLKKWQAARAAAQPEEDS
jgi:hypothetical protein